MAKGYWVIRVDITNPEQFNRYALANARALNKFGARFMVRAGDFRALEGGARMRNTIVEFPSYQAALDCWHSSEYQAAKKLREGAADLDLVVMEGYDGAQPSA